MAVVKKEEADCGCFQWLCDFLLAPTYEQGGGACFHVGQEAEYLSTTQGHWIICEVTQVRADGAVEINVKKGAWIEPKDFLGKLRDHTRYGKGRGAGYEVGALVDYFSISHGVWVRCNVTRVRSQDGALQVSAKPGLWLTCAEQRSKVRPPQDAPPPTASHDAVHKHVEWTFREAPGWFNPPAHQASKNQVYSKQAAEEEVLADPARYVGYSVDTNQGAAFVRELGSKLLGPPVVAEGWRSYCVECPTLGRNSATFEDAFVGPKGAFAHVGGLEGGKGQQAAFAVWKRPGRGEGLFDRPGLKLFGSIEPDDIRQGDVGDCWLLAAIAALSVHPGMIKRLFPAGNHLSQSGRYQVMLWSWKARAWRTVEVDDRLATKSAEAPTALFAQITVDGEIYVPLLEKAAAVLCGGYDFVHGNETNVALGMITGCDDNAHLSRDKGTGRWSGWRDEFTENRLWTKRVDMPGPRTANTAADIFAYKHYDNIWHDGCNGRTPKTDAEMWAAMMAWNESNYVLCCGMLEDGKTDQVTHECGLVFGHAYSILHIVHNIAGQNLNLLLLRNPWGKGEPKLQWHDADPIWDRHPQVAAALQWSSEKRKEDGTFWIRDVDFFLYFNDFHVVKCDMERSRPWRRADNAVVK
eukprot:TRINITY_DN64908_c0_g1_i1.p1 TRINITY_DN64908_c0_g1~~TRINITY_DN64908_c0_g1_i1.p1  ORF type:complete len:636 (-),score=97.77 TRINITY_DN64908_c0_g1_i1:70-1977(-)